MTVTSEMIDAGVLAWLRAGGPECDGVGLVGSIYKAMREVDPAYAEFLEARRSRFQPMTGTSGANCQPVELLWRSFFDAPIEVDAEIAPLVRALNEAGLETVASCSGHGHRPGNIALRDGREIIIARDFAEARKIDALFPLDINGAER